MSSSSKAALSSSPISSAPALPRVASRSVRLVKPEMSAKTQVPSIRAVIAMRFVGEPVDDEARHVRAPADQSGSTLADGQPAGSVRTAPTGTV